MYNIWETYLDCGVEHTIEVVITISKTQKLRPQQDLNPNLCDTGAVL